MNDRDKLRLHPAATREASHATQQPRTESVDEPEVEADEQPVDPGPAVEGDTTEGASDTEDLFDGQEE